MMKTATSSVRLLARLGATALVLLLSQQGLAAGTDAGTTIQNQAVVAYDVNSQIQTPIESDPNGNSTPGAGNATEFLVDRRVDFVLIEVGGAHTEVSPGDTDEFTAFQLTNNGNAIMDFDLSLTDLLLGASVHGELDTGDTLGNFRIRVANGDGPAGVPDLATDLAFVDELAEDDTVVIYVFADAGATLPNDAYDNFTLTATAADAADVSATPGVLDPILVESPGVDDPTVIESVFADAGNDGLESVDDGYHVNSAELVITKTAAVISDPFGSGKALPDAVIEYTVTIDNSAGAETAENVVMTDTIQIANVALELGQYPLGGGTGTDISVNGVGCTAAADADGCTYDGVTGDMTVNVPDILSGATATILFQVRISPL